jgi:hypothetical protein
MNIKTTITIPFQQYYFFASDCGKLQGKNEVPVSDLLAETLVLMAKEHPTILKDTSFFERERLRTISKNCVPMVIGENAVSELKKETKASDSKISLVARALINEYTAMDIAHRNVLLAKL